MDLSLQDGNEEFIVGGSILVGRVSLEVNQEPKNVLIGLDIMHHKLFIF
jgi:hypothetical protein